MTDAFNYDAWATALERGELLGGRCRSCETTFGTPVMVCPDCSHRGLEPTPLSETGIIHTVTRIEVAPTGFEGPFFVGIVELEDARLTARIEADSDEPEIGDNVRFAGGLSEAPDGSVAPLFRLE
ncbi:Zn-ribbon domain-containing OB-fold protein [Halocatena halophila]|uniref:Zn-ribbon domain-containing OB-fold protein n=1 Tax=Halocatena halophila TaxID=2814576 RepID=UPI002ED4FB69